MPAGRALVEFLTASILIILLPGPSVLFTVGRAIAYGRAAAVLTVLGNSFGALVLAALAAAGVGPLVQSSRTLMVAVQLTGAVFLVYLGVGAWRRRGDHASAPAAGAARQSRGRLVREGFTVGVLNPKTAVFFATVMPRFLVPGQGHAGRALAAMGAVFVAMAFVSDSAYGLLAGQVRTWFDGHPAALSRLGAVGGVLIAGLGAALAVATLVAAVR